jgi:hypothetical protein
VDPEVLVPREATFLLRLSAESLFPLAIVHSFQAKLPSEEPHSDLNVTVWPETDGKPDSMP